MHKLIIKPLAEKDTKNAANWYNLKREGLGSEFLLVLDAEINAIQRNPNHYQIVYNTLRRALITRFPYGIFFIIEDDTIFILAIIHTSRNPKVWRKRK